jgi:polyisoprenoid-binding protein YceI
MKPFRSATPLFLSIVAALAGVAAYSALRPTVAPSTGQPVRESAGVQASGEVSPTARVFEIDPQQSEARFITNEVLRGAPNEVIGVTKDVSGQISDVSGQIAADLTDPDTARLSPIRINARTFATESTQRDRAVQRFILSTDEHEYITFTPTTVHGLPGGGVGQSYQLQIAGQLTIRDVTRDTIFDATVTPQAPDVLTGTAATTINYADWNLSIPSVPFVASVDPQVRLELSFVAAAA